jgi:hypothetical protein
LKITSVKKTVLLVAVVAVLAIAALARWGIDDPFIRFAALFALAEGVVGALGVAACILVGCRVVLRLLPHDRREYYRRHTIRFAAVILAGVVVFVALLWVLNRHWFPAKLHPVSIAADPGLLLLVMWAMWSVLVPSVVRALILIPGALVYAVAVFVLLAVSGGGSRVGDQVSTRELGALGYVSWVPADVTGDKVGVSWDDEEKSFDGFNIYCSGISPSAYLINMRGDVVHEWSAQVEKDEYFGHVELLPGGDVLVTVTGRGLLLRLDWDSNVVWRLDDAFYHHDMAVARNGEVHLIARRFDLATVHGRPVPIIHDFIVTLSPDGKPIKERSFVDLMADEIPENKPLQIYRWMLTPRNLKRMVADKKKGVFARMTKSPLDVTHANSLEILERDYGGPFTRGRLLVCARDLDLIGVVDLETNTLAWSWGTGLLDRPHHPTMLDNGNILIFDNGMHRGASRVIELDPELREIVWVFDNKEFFSHSRGANQRLPNGNTLVTNSNSGHVFEVTLGGEIVWEFYNPATRERPSGNTGETVKERAAIYRMMRITDPENYPCLEQLQ